MKQKTNSVSGREITGISVAVCGLSMLAVMVQSRISPEIAFSHLLHIIIGSIVCAGLYGLGYERLVKWGKWLILPMLGLLIVSCIGYHGRMLCIGKCELFAPGLWIPFVLSLLLAGWIQKHPEWLETSPIKKVGIPFGLITAITVWLFFCQPWYSLAAMTVAFACIFYSLGKYNIRNLAKSVVFWIFFVFAILLLCCPARILEAHIGSMRLPSSGVAKWVMENSMWFGKGVSELEQIPAQNMPFPEADMVILTGTLEFGKIYLAATVLFFVTLLISTVSLTIKTKENGKRVVVGGMTAIILLPFILNFAVHAGLIPVFFINLPFVSCGGFCVTILSFAALGCLFTACKSNDIDNRSFGKRIVPAIWILLTILPATGAYFIMKDTVCRMPSVFLLTRIEKQTHPSQVAVYDIFFSREGSTFSAGDLEKYFSKIDRKVGGSSFKGTDFTAYHVTHPLASAMTEAEIRVLANELKKDGFLNHFFFHKRFIISPNLPLESKLEIISESIIAANQPKAFYACIANISTGQIVKEFTGGEPLQTSVLASAIKPFIIIAAIENNIVSWDTVIDCKNGRATWGTRRLLDTHGFGGISVLQVLNVGSNIGTALIAEKTGFEKINKTMADFGLPALAGQLAFSALGHETSVTPQQLAAAYLKLLKNQEYYSRLPWPITCTWRTKNPETKQYGNCFSNTLLGIKDGYLIIIIAKEPVGAASNSGWIRRIWLTQFAEHND